LEYKGTAVELKENLGAIEIKCELSTQELNLLRITLDSAIKSLKEIYEKFTLSVWKTLSRLLSIPEIRCKFLYCLFGETVKESLSFKEIKQRMEEFTPRSLTIKQVSELLPLCENYKSLSKNFKGESSNVRLLLKWIKKSVEHKVKEQLYIDQIIRHNVLIKTKQDIYQQYSKENAKIKKLKNTIINYKADIDYCALLPVSII
jgi:hypothetical protein